MIANAIAGFFLTGGLFVSLMRKALRPLISIGADDGVPDLTHEGEIPMSLSSPARFPSRWFKGCWRGVLRLLETGGTARRPSRTIPLLEALERLEAANALFSPLMDFGGWGLFGDYEPPNYLEISAATEHPYSLGTDETAPAASLPVEQAPPPPVSRNLAEEDQAREQDALEETELEDSVSDVVEDVFADDAFWQLPGEQVEEDGSHQDFQPLSELTAAPSSIGAGDNGPSNHDDATATTTSPAPESDDGLPHQSMWLGASLGTTFAAVAPSSSNSPPTPSVLSAAQEGAALAAFGRLPLRFEQNVGQFGAAVDYVVRGAGYQAGLHATGAYVAVTGGTPDAESLDATASMIGMELIGADSQAQGIGLQRQAGAINYLIGNDPSGHFLDVASYGRVMYRDVYAGIDVVYRSASDGNLEYDFHVAAGATPDAIALRFSGVDQLRVGEDGSLRLSTAAGELQQAAPFTYQYDASGRLREVDSHFVLSGDEVRFELGQYDATRELIIDPRWGYSTYAGGTMPDEVRSVAVDAANDVYLAGYTVSATFAGVPGEAFKSLTVPQVGVSDAFVLKLSADGASVVYLTYLGGSKGEHAKDIAVGNDGSAYVTGFTESADFHITANAWQNVYGGGNSDVFVTKLKPDGKSAAFSTYLGGVKDEVANSIALNNLGDPNIFIAGYIVDAPNMINNLAVTKIGPGGGTDALVARLTPTGNVDRLVSVGASGHDRANGIAVDFSAVSKIYVTGATGFDQNNPQSFPTTNGAFRRTTNQNEDAFVLKLDPTNQNPTFVYSTLFGGVGLEAGNDIAVDPSNDNVYVVGRTTTRPQDKFLSEAGWFFDLGPTHVFGWVPPNQPHNQQAWVARFDATGDPNPFLGAKYFAYIAGKDEDEATSIALSHGVPRTLYVSGLTKSDAGRELFPVFRELQPFRGHTDAFLGVFDPAQAGAASQLFTTYLGGEGVDRATSVAVDQAGNAYIGGATSSATFRQVPQVVAGFRKTNSGSSDGFAVKITDIPVAANRPRMGPVGNRVGMVGMPLNFTVSVTDADGDPVTFALDQAPTGASIDPVTGAFTWTPSATQGPAVHTFAIQASDPYGLFDEQVVTAVIWPTGGGIDLPGDTLTASLTANLLDDVKTEIDAVIGDGPYGTLDVDLFRITVKAGQLLRADIDAVQLDGGGSLSSLNGYLRIFDAAGTQVAANDDGVDPDTGISSTDAAVGYAAPSDGVYYVGVSGAPNNAYSVSTAGSGVAGSTGAYRLQITAIRPESQS